MLKAQPNQEERSICICLSGRVSQGQLPYLDELIQYAHDSGLTVLLDLEQISVLDLPAARYMAEGTRFTFSHCPSAVRQWIRREKKIAELTASIRR